MSIRIRFTTAGGDVEDVPLLPTVIREQEQEHGKPWSEIVTLSSEWAFYGAWRYMQLRRDAWMSYQSLHKSWVEALARGWSESLTQQPVSGRTGPMQLADGLALVGDDMQAQRCSLMMGTTSRARASLNLLLMVFIHHEAKLPLVAGLPEPAGGLLDGGFGLLQRRKI